MRYSPEYVLTVPDPSVPGWVERLAENGIAVEHWANDGKFYCADPVVALAIIGAHDPVAFARKQKLAELETKYRAVQRGGHTTANSIPILTDEASEQAMILAYLLVQADASQVYVFKDANGTWRSLNKANTMALMSDFAIWRKTVDQRAMAIAAQINAANTWQAVQAIDVTANWPG